MINQLVWAPPSMHSAVWKNPPEVLLTSLQPRQISEWRGKNKWADPLDMIIFTDDDPPEAVRRRFLCIEFAPQTGWCPHMVIHPPGDSAAELFTLLAMTSKIEKQIDAARAYQSAVAAVARRLHRTRCAWIQPESDHALGACIVTKHVGMCVAYSQKPMIDSIGAIAAGSCGVNVQTLGSIKSVKGDV